MALLHGRSLAILADVGVRVDAPWARELLTRAGATRADPDGIIRLPGDLVGGAIEAAPSHLDLYDRRGEPVFRIGPGQPTRFGIGVTALYYQDPRTDDLAPFAREHLGTVVGLGQSLMAFDIISTPGIVQDVAPDLSDLYATLEMVTNATKPLVILVSADRRYTAVLDLLEHLLGDRSARPCVIPYVNPITPLALHAGALDKIRHTVRRGLPLIFSSYGMAGASAPIGPAPGLALLNAELLAGLTMAQTLREGTPVVLGLLPAYFDMRGKGSFYDVTSYVLNLACAELMNWYGLPHAGTSGSGMGWGAGVITAAHQWVNHVTSCTGKVGLVPFVGDTLGSKAFSPAAMVYANDAIAQARRLADGFRVEPTSAELDEIASVGPGGSYLLADSTLARMREAYYSSDVFARMTLEEWRAAGQPRAEDLLRRRTVEMIAALEPLPDHDELIVRGERFISDLSPLPASALSGTP